MTDSQNPKPASQDNDALKDRAATLVDLLKDPATVEQALKDHPELSQVLMSLNKKVTEVVESNEEEGMRNLRKNLIGVVTGLSPEDTKKLLEDQENADLYSELDEDHKFDPQASVSPKRLTMESEMAKVAQIEDPKAKRRAFTAIKAIPMLPIGYDDQRFMIGNFGTHDSLVKRGASPEVMERVLKLLKGEDTKNDQFITMLRYEETLKLILVEPAKEGHAPNLDIALPSYAVWRLFKKGKLAEHGITDKEFLEVFSCNDIGLYLNFAQADTHGNIKIARLNKKTTAELEKAIQEEMEEIALEILPSINAKRADYVPNRGIESRPEILQYVENLRVNRETGAIEAKGKENEPLNELCLEIHNHNKAIADKRQAKLDKRTELSAKINGKRNSWDASKEYKGELPENIEDLPQDAPLKPLLSRILYELKALDAQEAKEKLERFEGKEKEAASLIDKLKACEVKLEEQAALLEKANKKWGTGRREDARYPIERKIENVNKEIGYIRFDLTKLLTPFYKGDSLEILIEQKGVEEGPDSLTAFVKDQKTAISSELEEKLEKGRKLLALYDKVLAEIERLKSEGATIDNEDEWRKSLFSKNARSVFEQ